MLSDPAGGAPHDFRRELDAALRAELQEEEGRAQGTAAPFVPLQAGGRYDRGFNRSSEDCRTLSSMFSSGLIERPVSWVALAGFMGTGKSRIGWELSRALALHFVDTD